MKVMNTNLKLSPSTYDIASHVKSVKQCCCIITHKEKRYFNGCSPNDQIQMKEKKTKSST